MSRVRLSSFGPVFALCTASHAACSRTMAISMFSRAGVSLHICLGPDSGADGHNEGELTNSVHKDGAERTSLAVVRLFFPRPSCL